MESCDAVQHLVGNVLRSGRDVRRTHEPMHVTMLDALVRDEKGGGGGILPVKPPTNRPWRWREPG